MRAHGVECVIIILREKVAALICLFFFSRPSLRCAADSLRSDYFRRLRLSNGHFQTLCKKAAAITLRDQLLTSSP